MGARVPPGLMHVFGRGAGWTGEYQLQRVLHGMMACLLRDGASSTIMRRVLREGWAR